MEYKSVVILSGGLDSTVLLHYIKRDFPGDVHGLTFLYGQRHHTELSYAQEWGKKLCKTYRVIELPFLKEFGGSALTTRTIDVPKEHYTHENQRLTVVPNRNMIMLSIAISLAESKGVSLVFYGPHKNDHTIYPDCRPEFVDALNVASMCGTYNQVRVAAPFVDMYKKDIVTLGAKLGVPFAETWSCYEGRNLHCGKCGTCQERKEAFKLAGIEDPTEYEEN